MCNNGVDASDAFFSPSSCTSSICHFSPEKEKKNVRESRKKRKKKRKRKRAWSFL